MNAAWNTCQETTNFQTYESVFQRVDYLIIFVFGRFLTNLTFLYQVLDVLLVVGQHFIHNMVVPVEKLDAGVDEIVDSTVELAVRDPDSNQLVHVHNLVRLGAFWCFHPLVGRIAF